MDTHSNADHPVLDDLYGKRGPAQPGQVVTERATDAIRMAALEEKAGRMVDKLESTITAGAPGEQSLGEQMQYGVLIRRMPDDEDCHRISLGQSRFGEEIRYLVFRGDPAECADLLDRAARALRSCAKRF